jgi:nicotinamidase/pyrazinamidase
VHCVQHTPGADFAPGLKVGRVAMVFQKGTDPGLDSYSGFFDNAHRRATGMGDWLKEHGIESIYICGLATDYCVRFTALDGLALGFRTFVIEDGCRGVEVRPGDAAEAVAEMRRAGAKIISSADVGET